MPIISVSEPFNIPALGGNPAHGGASKLIDLTDVSAGASNPGAVLTELEPVGGVRQFGLNGLPNFSDLISNSINDSISGVNNSIIQLNNDVSTLNSQIGTKANVADIDTLNSKLSTLAKPMGLWRHDGKFYKTNFMYDNSYPKSSDIGNVSINAGEYILFPLQIYETVNVYNFGVAINSGSDISLAIYDYSGNKIYESTIVDEINNPEYNLLLATSNITLEPSIYMIAIKANSNNVNIQSITNTNQYFHINSNTGKHTKAIKINGSSFIYNLSFIYSYQDCLECPRIFFTAGNIL